jgi:hypothetical protein
LRTATAQLRSFCFVGVWGQARARVTLEGRLERQFQTQGLRSASPDLFSCDLKTARQACVLLQLLKAGFGASPTSAMQARMSLIGSKAPITVLLGGNEPRSYCQFLLVNPLALHAAVRRQTAGCQHLAVGRRGLVVRTDSSAKPGWAPIRARRPRTLCPYGRSFARPRGNGIRRFARDRRFSIFWKARVARDR